MSSCIEFEWQVYYGETLAVEVMCMKRLCVLLLIVSYALVLGSCASLFRAPNDPWVGATKDQLVKQLGSTSSITSDNHGGEIWVYIKSKLVEGHALGSAGGDGSMTQQQIWVMDKFFIDANGVIYQHQESQI